MASREFSAGGVVVRQVDGAWQVAVIRPQGRNTMALPKGHIDPGENAEQAATREVNEETGLVGELLQKIDDVKYVYTFRGRTIFKEVSFFLFRAVGGQIDQITTAMRHEVDEASWISLQEAKTRLSYPGERSMVELASALLGKTT